MFDVRLSEAKNREIKFDCKYMNMFKFIWFAKNNVQVTEFIKNCAQTLAISRNFKYKKFESDQN